MVNEVIFTVCDQREVRAFRLVENLAVRIFDVASALGSPQIGQEVADAFMRVYGIDLKKAGALNSAYLETIKIR